MQITNVQDVQTVFADDSIVGLSTLRNIPVMQSGGTISTLGAEIMLSTNGTANGLARLSTAERAFTIPGNDLFVQLGLRIPIAPASAQVALWGLYDDAEGFGFGQDATDSFIFVKTGGSLTKSYRSSWNIDKLDGNGPSKATLGQNVNGLFYTFRSTWYGGVEFGIYMPEAGMELLNVHRFVRPQPMYASPHLPVRVEVQNNATSSTNLQMALGVRKVAIIGSGKPSYRPVSQEMLSVSCPHATQTPVLSLYRRTGDPTPTRLKNLEVITDQALIVTVASGSTITGPSWVDTQMEGDCQVDIQQHGQGSIYPVYKTIVPAGFTVHDFDPDLIHPIEDNPVTIYAQPIGTTDATASFNLRWHEQW